MDPIADRVRDVVDIQARQVLRAIPDAEPAERPAQRILVARARPLFDHRKPRPLGQQLAVDDAMREPAIAALQEADDCVDRREVAIRVREQVRDRRRQPAAVIQLIRIVLRVLADRPHLMLGRLRGARPQHLDHPAQPGATEHPQEQLERGVRLKDLEAEARLVLAQEPGQVRRRGVRRVELGHRRCDEQEPHGRHTP